MGYRLYVDIFWITVCLIDLAAMLGMVYILKYETRIKRTIAMAVISASLEVFLYLWLSRYWLYRFVMIGVVNPLLVIGLCFPSKKMDYFRGYLLVNGLLLVIGGTQTLFFYWMPGPSSVWLWQVGLSAVCVFLCIKQRERCKYRQHLCEVELKINDRRLILSAYHDTGNLLRDPFTGKAVSVVEKSYLLAQGIDTHLIRYIPYQTVGHSNALLAVFTIEQMQIKRGDNVVQIKQPVIGLSENKLFFRQDIHMILHSELL